MISEAFVKRTYNQGELIYSQGEAGSDLFVIETGTLAGC